MNPSIAPIPKTLHAQRPIRGLPGGALCVSGLAAGRAWQRDCGGGGRVCHRVGLFEPRCLGLVFRLFIRSCLACLGSMGLWELVSLARRHPEMGVRGWEQQHQRRLDVVRWDCHRAGGSMWSGACSGPAMPDFAPHPGARRSATLDLGRARHLSSAVERPAASPGVEPRLKMTRQAQFFATGGLASLDISPFTPWVIFPRA